MIDKNHIITLAKHDPSRRDDGIETIGFAHGAISKTVPDEQHPNCSIIFFRSTATVKMSDGLHETPISSSMLDEGLIVQTSTRDVTEKYMPWPGRA